MIYYDKEVADYLNNKFGDDFTLAEPYPYWMELPRESFETEEPMTDMEYKCWCDAATELRMEILCELGEDNNELKNVKKWEE